MAPFFVVSNQDHSAATGFGSTSVTMSIMIVFSSKSLGV